MILSKSIEKILTETLHSLSKPPSTCPAEPSCGKNVFFWKNDLCFQLFVDLELQIIGPLAENFSIIVKTAFLVYERTFSC